MTEGSRLKNKLILPALVVTTLGVTLSSALNYLKTKDNLMNEIRIKNDYIVSTIASSAEILSNKDQLQRLIYNLAAQDDINSISIISLNKNEVILSSKNEYLGKNSTDLTEKTKSATNYIKEFTSRDIHNPNSLNLTKYLIHAEFDINSELRKLEVNVMQNLIVNLVLLVILFATLYYFLNRSILIPLQNLTRYIQSKTNKEKVEENLLFSNDEIGTLAQTLNDLFVSQELQQITIEHQNIQISNTAKMTAIGELAGGIAHEINNPLAIINSNAEQLIRLKRVDKLTEEQFYLKVEKIIAVVDRISRIVSGLMLFSKDTTNEPFENVSLHDLIHATSDYSYERCKNNGVHFVICDVPKEVSIDCKRTQIAQVLLNLVNNSFDAIVGTKHPWIRLQTEFNGETIKISVTDSGHGIPDDIAQKIMQPFFTTKDVGKGTGLGLSTSRGIIEAHEGSFYLDKACKNTRFVFEIPVNQKKMNNSKAA